MACGTQVYCSDTVYDGEHVIVWQHNCKTITFCSVDHRHSSLHIHHPLSKLPLEGKKKKSGKKKREAGRRRASGSGEASGAPTIEEEEEEDGKEDTTTATPDTDSDMHNEDDQVGWHTIRTWS